MPLFALVAAGAAAAAPVPPAEDRALFADFKAVCSAVRSLPRMQSAALRAKWQAVEPAAHPQLKTLIEEGRKAALKEEPEARFFGSQYRKNVAGRELWLILSRYVDKIGIWGNGCRIYHFDAAAPWPVEELVALMGRPHTGTLPLPDNQTKYLWEPGWKDGHSVEISYITGNDPFSQRFGLKGQVFTAQAIGGF